MRYRSELPFIYLNFTNMITLNSYPKSKYFALIMPWNIKNLLLPSFCLKMEQLFKDLSLELHLKMGVQKENTDTFWIRLEHFFYLLLLP